MDNRIKSQLSTDFEKYMISFFATFKRFSLEDFGTFAATVLNHNINNHIIAANEKKEAAYFLATLYNKGIGNRITEEHLQQIAALIEQDYTVDFEVYKRIFG
ncbi:hypothetical protein ACL9RF_05655 [Sphingobacterium sp. Mn56C]|uniref:hypothetical protein n=1 Tax=Sphingobacterium sp. Mn56C TaxID=3395261 RepID=UPI003BC6FA26